MGASEALKWRLAGDKMICCFFGHGDAPCDVYESLLLVLTDLIDHGVDSFLVGNHGNFDLAVLNVLRSLKESYPHIIYHVVLAYMPGYKEGTPLYEPWETLYPEGLETIYPRYAISWRNRWMVQEADVVVTYITHPWGGAAEFVELAERKHKRVINIASMMDSKTEK